MSHAQSHSSPQPFSQGVTQGVSQAVPVDPLLAGLAAPDDDPAQGSADRFNALLPRVVAQVVGEGEAAQEALETGGFVLNESTVVMRLNPDNDYLEFFCDIGLPDPHHLEPNFRTALELNLCRTYPGVTFGVHPESGRLVATTATHMLLVADDEVCLQALDLLTGLVGQLRANRTFMLLEER
jgi:hypothetical protein